ncbi:hypothetical protein L209DRAFT_472321 [Thermothelomyces heterothallicus CBS 203.75]
MVTSVAEHNLGQQQLGTKPPFFFWPVPLVARPTTEISAERASRCFERNSSYSVLNSASRRKIHPPWVEISSYSRVLSIRDTIMGGSGGDELIGVFRLRGVQRQAVKHLAQARGRLMKRHLDGRRLGYTIVCQVLRCKWALKNKGRDQLDGHLTVLVSA